MKTPKLQLSQFVPLCLVLNLFLMRPSALGQSFTPIAMGVALVLLFFHFMQGRRQAFVTTPVLKAEMVWTGLAFILFWIYLLPVSMQGSPDFEGIAKEFISALVILVCYGIILVGVQANSLFFRKLCTVISLIGWSSCITLMLGAVVGYDSLYLTNINIKGYESSNLEIATGAIYFPFSMLYSKMTSGSLDLMRFNGFFREAGIYQGIACFCFVYEALTRRSKWVMGGLIVGTIAAFSSIGIVILLLMTGAMAALRMRSNATRYILLVALVVFAYPVAMYTPYIGLDAKSDTHSTSISDRTEAVSGALKYLGRNPLGRGLSNGGSTGGNESITLVAYAGQIGFIGFLLQVFILSGWRFRKGRNSNMKLLICSPLLLTALLSQPIAGSPMMYVLPMVFVSLPSRKNGKKNATNVTALLARGPIHMRSTSSGNMAHYDHSHPVVNEISNDRSEI